MIISFTCYGQTVVNGDFDGLPDIWDCDLTDGLGVEVNFETVYGGVSTTNMVAEIDVTVGICQSIGGFTPGQIYELTFDCSGRTSTCGPIDQSMIVTIDGGVLAENISKSNVDFELQNERFCFTATQATHLLTFASTTFPEVSCGVVVDNILILPFTVNLGEDQILCEGDNVILDASAMGTSYEWQDGSTGSTFNATSPGTYTVDVYGEFCPFSEDITVTFITNEPDLGPDLILCQGDNMTLDATTADATYLWHDGSVNATFLVTEPGVFFVDVTVGNCTVNEEIEIVYNTDEVDLGEDVLLCAGESVTLQGDVLGATYVWQDATTGSTHDASQTGTYSVIATIDGCSSSDEVLVTVNNDVINLGPDVTICEGETLTLDATTTNGTYLWQDGTTDETFIVAEAGSYSVDVTIGSCAISDEITIAYEVLSVDLGLDNVLCEGETMMLDATNLGGTYLWQDGSVSSTYAVSQAGTYSVEVTGVACIVTDEIVIDYNIFNVNLGPDVDFCDGENFTFDATTTDGTYLWQDGSTEPTFTADQEGTYDVEVTVNGCTDNDEVFVTINPIPAIDLGEDQFLCEGDNLILDATWPGATYLWQTSETGATFLVDQAGTYNVDVNANGCTASDEILVTYSDLVLNLGGNQSLCEGESVTLDATNTDATYLWQDGSTDPTFDVSVSGTYTVTVTQGICTLSESVDITFGSLDIDLGPDLTVCDGSPTILDVTVSGGSYVWQDGSTNSTFTVTESGMYTVDVTSGSCDTSDDINVVMGTLTLNLGGDQSLCEGESITLDATIVGATYLWQDGSTDPTFDVSESGTYSVTVTQGVCTLSESVVITFGTLEVDLGPDQILCDTDPVIIDATTSGATYLWQDGSTNSTFTTSSSGTYSVEITAGSCTANDEINVEFGSLSLDLGGDQSLCEGESLTLDATNTDATYLWQDGSTDPTYDVSVSGTYSVTVTQGVCTLTESVVITFGTLEVDLGPDQILCDTDPFIIDATTSGATYLWQDGSTNSTFTTSSSGTYSVEISSGSCTANDEINIEFGSLSLNLGGDQSLCEGESITLDATNLGATYLWQDGSTEPTYDVNVSGTYSVTVTQGACTLSESVVITFGTLEVDLGDDLTLCSGETLTLDPSISGASYLWQDGSTSETFVVSVAGIYSVEVTAGSCTATDEIFVDFGTLSFTLGNDTSLCVGDELILDPQIPGAIYLWQDGSSESSLTVDQSGVYSVEVNSGTCSAIDEINVIFNEIPNIDLGPDASYCVGQEITLDATYPSATYLWQNSATASTLTVDEAGVYSVDVTSEGCTGYDNITISFGTINVDLGDDIALCEGENTTLDATISGATYLWSDGSTESILTVDETGSYSVTVTTDECVGIDEISINIGNPDIDLGNDTTLCAGEILILDAYIPGATYVWQDGSTDSIFEVINNGTYEVEITFGECSSSSEINIDFIAAPNVDLGPDQQICEGNDISLDATWPDATYQWHDLTTGPVFTTNIAGDYWVSVSLGTCTTTDSISISTGLPEIDLGNDTTVCAGTSITLMPTGDMGNYIWQDGSTADTYTVSSTGMYSVQLEVNGCVNSDSVFVDYAPLPSASISGGMIHCPTEMVNLQVEISGTPPFLLGFTKDGIPLTSVETSAYSYQLATDESGVYEVSSVIDAFCYAGPQNNTAITDYPPLTLDLSFDAEICVDENVTVTAQVAGGNGDTYSSQWIDNNGNVYYENPLTLIGEEDIVLTFSATDLCGTPIEGNVDIDVQIPPVPEIITSVDSICAQTTVIFESNNDDENIDCIWVFDDDNTEFGCGPIEQNYSESGFHSVSLTMQTSAGCEHTTTLDSVIFVLPLPSAGYTFLASEGTTLSPGIQFNNGSYNAEIYSWDFGDGQTSNEESPMHIYPYDEAEEYIACITAINEVGCEDTQCHIVEILPELIIHVPNSFTPNEDGVNDLFKPVFNDVVLAEYEFIIYDRGGMVIFESQDQDQFWNGSNPRTQNYYVPDGVYTYQIILREEDDSETKEYRGNITLIR